MIKITSSNDALEQELTCVRAERGGWRDAYEDAKRDAETARADLAAARALLSEAQDVIYNGKPNARSDIDLLRRIDAALAGEKK